MQTSRRPAATSGIVLLAYLTPLTAATVLLVMVGLPWIAGALVAIEVALVTLTQVVTRRGNSARAGREGQGGRRPATAPRPGTGPLIVGTMIGVIAAIALLATYAARLG